MRIPEGFLAKAARQFGEAGPGWVAALPEVVARCEAQWGLTDLVPAPNLSINLVCYGRSATHGPVVLKIAGPHDEGPTEMTALRLYDGRHACRCLARDQTHVAMLLERLSPGHDLRSLPDREAQRRIGAELVATLPIPLAEDHGLPHYRDWVEKAIAITHARHAPDARAVRLMAAAREAFAAISPPDAPRYLLHGDLHHENMLLGRGGQWLAIDPQGVIGPPVLETGRFVQNHVIRNAELSMAELDHTVGYVAERLDVPKRTVARALFVLHVLSHLWGMQMNDTPARIARGFGQCKVLLGYAQRA